MKIIQFKKNNLGQLFYIILILFSVDACTTVKLYTEEDVSVERKFGFINLIEPSSTGSLIETNFLGLGYMDNTFVLGYQKTDALYMSEDDCTIFIDAESVIENTIIDLLKDFDCTWIYKNKKDGE